MLKSRNFFLTCWIIAILVSGCGNKESIQKKMYYGNELYNASYIYSGEGEVLHIIPLMSKKNISEAIDVQVYSSDGTFKLRYEIEDGGFEYKGYNLYRICLFLSDIEFLKSSMDIKSIQLLFANDEKDELELNKCQIVKSVGNLNTDISVNGSPLRMPADMLTLPLELSAEKRVTINDVYLTNEDMVITEYPDGNGGYTNKFSEFVLNDDESILTWIPKFSIKNDVLSAYKNYATSIVICYSCDGEEYYCLPGIPRTIYNPFDVGWGSIEKYFDYLGID